MEDKDIIERAEKFIGRAKTFWDPHHKRFTAIKTFTRAHGEKAQWDDNEWTDRQQSTPARLTLTENLLGPFVNQVANDLKQSDFGAYVKPKDSGTDVELSETRQGIHRGVQQIGGFKQVLSRAIDDLIDGGLGCWRFITKNADPMSFNKEIEYLEGDPTRMYHGDGSHRKADFSDVIDSIYFQPYTKERFKSEFDEDPDAFLGGDSSALWGSRDSGPCVSEYFFREEKPETLVKCTEDQSVAELLARVNMRPGGSYYLTEFKAKLKEITQALGVKAEDFIAKDEAGKDITRPTTSCQIWWAKLAAKRILKKEKWPGYYIPNFVATGRKVWVNGEVKYYGLAEPAVHVQKAHNYAFSALVERAGMAPKAQTFMPIEGMDPKYQKIYDNLATWSGIVPYKSRDKQGAIDRPSREPPIQSDPAFIGLRQMTLQGIRDVLGMWETSLGGQSNEKSGVAIQTRERQADTGNYDWGANLATAAEHCFVATDEILNKVIDVATQVRIVGDDDKEKVIWAASLEENDPNPNQYFDLNRGKFDIYCKMSPSADTKRDDQIRGMEMLFQNNPQLAAGLAPEFIGIQDWKNAKKMADIARAIRATQFPGVDFGDNEDKQKQIPPEVQQQMQAMQQQTQQMQEELQKMKPEMDRAHQAEARTSIENQSIKAQKAIEEAKIQIERFRADTERMKVEAEIGEKQGKMLLASDELQHTKTMDEQSANMAASQHVHGIHQDRTASHLQENQQMHGQAQDKEKFNLEGRKLDQAKEIAASKAVPTGVTGSKSPKPGVKG